MTQNINLASLTTSQGISIYGANGEEKSYIIPGDSSGHSVKEAGDVNGDGFADVIIGAPNANNYAGISYVIYGGTSLSTIDLSNLNPTQGFSISSSEINANNGNSVSGAGDVNGDGYDDIIVGPQIQPMAVLAMSFMAMFSYLILS